MNITIDEVASWVIIGILAGSLAGLLVTGKKAGFGRSLNVAVGMAGTLIGGLLFKLLRINLGLLGAITVSFEEVVEGFLGSLVLLGIIWITQTTCQEKGSVRGRRAKAEVNRESTLPISYQWSVIMMSFMRLSLSVALASALISALGCERKPAETKPDGDTSSAGSSSSSSTATTVAPGAQNLRNRHPGRRALRSRGPRHRGRPTVILS